MNMTPVLHIDGIQKSYGRKNVLRGGSLTAFAGQLVCIVGENGSGKSTLLKIIAGMLKPDQGAIEINGKMGYCPQQCLLYPYLSVDEHFRLFGAAYRISPKELPRISQELMEQFQFAKYHKFKVHELSGGTQQKLNLSLSLLQNPQLLLLDEPYAGFDFATYQSFMNYTQDALKGGKCIVMVSHLVYEMKLFDAVFNLEDGALHESDT